MTPFEVRILLRWYGLPLGVRECAPQMVVDWVRARERRFWRRFRLLIDPGAVQRMVEELAAAFKTLADSGREADEAVRSLSVALESWDWTCRRRVRK